MSNCQHELIQTQTTPAASSGLIYAVGELDCHFPSESVRQEYLRIRVGIGTQVTDEQALYQIFKTRPHLAGEMIWTFSVNKVPLYEVMPYSETERGEMIGTLNPARDWKVLLIGRCGKGGKLPRVTAHLVNYFMIEDIIRTIPQPISQAVTQKKFREEVGSIFKRVYAYVNNPGNTNPYRAVNYVTFHTPRLFTHIWDLENPIEGEPLYFQSLETRENTLNVDRNLVDVIFSFWNKEGSGRKRYFLNVNTGGMYPFPATNLKTLA